MKVLPCRHHVPCESVPPESPSASYYRNPAQHSSANIPLTLNPKPPKSLAHSLNPKAKVLNPKPLNPKPHIP